MTTPHLSDQQAQQLATTEALVPTAAVSHLHACARCQAQVASYRVLFTGLATAPRPIFAFDPAALVVPHLSATAARARFPWGACLGGALVLVFVMGCLAFFGAYIQQLLRGVPAGFYYLLLLPAAALVLGQGLDLFATHRRQLNSLHFSYPFLQHN